MKRAAREPYDFFAEIYDQIMCSVDYEGWADYIGQLLARFDCKPTSVIDLACGTGSSTLPFARRGYRTTGIDLSPAMLDRARLKAGEAGLVVKYFEQDLCNLDLPENYDLALLFQDGLNYLLTDEKLGRSLEQIHAALNPGSLFIFDLTRPALRPENDKGSVCWADEDNFTLIWESNYNMETEIWTIQLTAFNRDDSSSLYHKFCEEHKEKDHCPDKVTEMLIKAGFKLLGLYPSFSLEPTRGTEPKLTFVAKKPFRVGEN